MIYNETKFNSDWDVYKLNQLGTFSRGKSRHRPRNDDKLFEGGGYPLVQTGDIKKANLYVNQHTIEYNDFGLAQSKIWNINTLCITIAANIAETAILAYPMCFPDSIVGFNANKELCSEVFMHYIFTYIKQAIQNSASGSIQDNINIDYLEKLEFKIPSLDIQNKIISILYSIDKKIELNNKINNELEKLAKIIYNYWFLQFDFPDENGKPYKSSGGKMIWNKILKRKIPKDWEVKSINEILIEKEKSNVQVSQAQEKTGKYPFFTSGDSVLEWNDPFVDGMNCFLCTGGNANIKYYIGKAAYSTDTWCISAKNNLENYLYLWIKSLGNGLNLRYFSGTGLKHLQKDLFRSTKIVIPKSHIIDRFNQVVTNLYIKISDNYVENKELKALRDFLLPLLMNGQVSFIN